MDSPIAFVLTAAAALILLYALPIALSTTPGLSPHARLALRVYWLLFALSNAAGAITAGGAVLEPTDDAQRTLAAGAMLLCLASIALAKATWERMGGE